MTELNIIATPDNLIIGCPMVWYEVRRGLIAKGATVQMQYFQNLFATFVWQDYTRNNWEQAARLWVHRRAKGLSIGDADLLIGVFALNRDAILVTNNEKDFVELGVNTENWTQ
jgi:tRNA(fMet)-specific endonuclease VapC